jgi:hypothetical protein
MRAINTTAEMQKPDRLIADAVPGTLPPRTIQTKQTGTRQGPFSVRKREKRQRGRRAALKAAAI